MAKRIKRKADREYVRALRAEIDASRDGQPHAWDVVCEEKKKPPNYFDVEIRVLPTRNGGGWITAV